MSDALNTRHLKPHVDEGTCGKCRKRFEAGDRIMPAYIFERFGAHPANMNARGNWIKEEHEYVHVCCADPKLVKGLIAVP